MNGPIDFSLIRNELISIPNNWNQWSPYTLLGELEKSKQASIVEGRQDIAKKFWCYETIANIYNMYIEAFKEMKNKNFYETWCIIERIEIHIGFLSRHFNIQDNDLYLEFIYQHTRRFQGLYPYAVFLSPEILGHEKKCNICNRIVTPRNNCGHRVGEIYNGQMCCRIVTKPELLSVSLVTNPVQKYSVVFTTDSETGKKVDHYDYSLVRFVIDRLASPFHEWSYKWIKIQHPHERFSNYSPEDSCPCESGDKYKDCCLPKKGVLRPHCDIAFSVLPPAAFSMFEYSDK